jgi:hypothetical protein
MDRNDAAVMVGGAMLGAGLWWIYPPMALIVVGLALVTFGIAGAWQKAGKGFQRGDAENAEMRR